MLVDYHIHSNFSPDGQNSILHLADAAIIRGLSEIAITDHCEIALKASYDSEGYFHTIEEVEKLYGKRLTIKCALEIGNPHFFGTFLDNLLEHKYDFVLASVHEHGDQEYYTQDLSETDPKTFISAYFDELKKAIAYANFDCLAHLDLPKRYFFNFGKTVNFMDYREQLEEILRIIIAMNKGLEVNTSGLRQKMGLPMPDLAILRLYKSLGGEIVTIGSDAHCASHVGNNVDAAQDLLLEAGFKYQALYTLREPHFDLL